MSAEVDWSSIENVCVQRSMGLEKNDEFDRPAFDAVGPVIHKDSCWLGKNYANQPEMWSKGCDMGCLKEAAQKRRASPG